jgi:hypothetical protein
MCAADFKSLDCRSCTPRVGVAVVSAYGVDTAYMLLLYDLSSVSSRRTMSAVGGPCQHWKRQCWQYGAVLQARISVCAHRGCYGSWSALGSLVTFGWHLPGSTFSDAANAIFWQAGHPRVICRRA